MRNEDIKIYGYGHWMTIHGYAPRNKEELASHHFANGVFFAGHGVMEEELREVWPEILTNPDSMRGYRWACHAMLAGGDEVDLFWENLCWPIGSVVLQCGGVGDKWP